MARQRFTGASRRRNRPAGFAAGIFKAIEDAKLLRKAKPLPNARRGAKPGPSPAAPAQRRQALDPGARKALENRRATLEWRHAKDFKDLERDPDRKLVDDKSRDEARTALDMREQGALPRDIQRPTENGKLVGGKGDFVGTVDGKKVYFDVKTWPDLGLTEKGVFKSPKFEGNILSEIQRGRVAIVDTRHLNQGVIDEMVRVVNQNGWSRHVIWYP